MKKGKLFLIPNRISESSNPEEIFTSLWKEDIRTIQFFLVENLKTARRFLSSLKIFPSMELLSFLVLDKDTTTIQLSSMMEPLKRGLNIGVISESGCPGVADPGALAVAYAHENNFQVKPLVGPSSVILALMASGVNGQQFSFHGYLPIETKELKVEIRRLEKESKEKGYTQIFIESPHRNNRLLQMLLTELRPTTHLCIALDITGDHEQIVSKRVKSWPKMELLKLPCIFLFQA